MLKALSLDAGSIVALLTLCWVIYERKLKKNEGLFEKVDDLHKRVGILESHWGLFWSGLVTGHAPWMKKPIHKELDDFMDLVVERGGMSHAFDPAMLSRDEECRGMELIQERLDDSSEGRGYKSSAYFLKSWLEMRIDMRKRTEAK